MIMWLLPCNCVMFLYIVYNLVMFLFFFFISLPFMVNKRFSIVRHCDPLQTTSLFTDAVNNDSITLPAAELLT